MNYLLIAVGLALALAGVLGRTTLPKAAGAGLTALGAALVAAGGLRLTGDATTVDWLVAIPGAIAGTVFHVMGLFGEHADRLYEYVEQCGGTTDSKPAFDPEMSERERRIREALDE